MRLIILALLLAGCSAGEPQVTWPSGAGPAMGLVPADQIGAQASTLAAATDPEAALSARAAALRARAARLRGPVIPRALRARLQRHQLQWRATRDRNG